MAYKEPVKVFGYWVWGIDGAKAFARKTMRINNTLIQKDLENEIKVLDFLCKDKHANIIEILQHGWLEMQGKTYFIDMELADISLADYIECAF